MLFQAKQALVFKAMCQSAFLAREKVKRSCSQAFVVETVETRNKNRDDFHCMQMTRLVMSMWFISGDD